MVTTWPKSIGSWRKRSYHAFIFPSAHARRCVAASMARSIFATCSSVDPVASRCAWASSTSSAVIRSTISAARSIVALNVAFIVASSSGLNTPSLLSYFMLTPVEHSLARKWLTLFHPSREQNSCRNNRPQSDLCCLPGNTTRRNGVLRLHYVTLLLEECQYHPILNTCADLPRCKSISMPTVCFRLAR